MCMHDAPTMVPLETPRSFGVGTVEIRKRRFDYKGWSHDQRLTAVVVLAALGMFFLFAPYLVVLFFPQGDLALLRDLNRSPEAVQIVIFMVVCKMVGLGIIFSAMPFFFRSLFSGEPRPAPPADIRIARERALTRIERALLEHGHATVAQVTRVQWPDIDLAWRDHTGSPRSASARSHAPDSIAQPAVGERVHLLYDPLAPEDVVVPRILDVVFDPEHLVADRRPPTVPAAAPPEEHRGGLTLGLQPTLHRVPRAFWRSIRQAVRRARCPGLGPMSLEGDELRIGDVRVCLDRPFSVSLSAWANGDDTVELTIAVRQRHVVPAAPALLFRVEQAMAHVAATVPTGRSDAPWVTTEAFAPLWAALRFYLAAHGETVDAQLYCALSPSETMGTLLEARVMTK